MDDKKKELLDPIEFLGLQMLNKEQKENLYKPLLADMGEFIINSLVESLEEGVVDKFLEKLGKIVNDPTAIMELVKEYDPDFSQDKVRWAEEYRVNFKLQKFIGYL